mmetsp:Transcript_22622/g.73826  ORF Transcript_22622/g.73826 Transcript_22622/m.73826 type:complete len:596 (-) Transcript_22622:1321-3108(-)
MLCEEWLVDRGLRVDERELRCGRLAHRVAVDQLLLEAQHLDRAVVRRDRAAQVVLLQAEVRHVHVRRLTERVDADRLLAVLDGRLEVLLAVELEDAEVDVREGELVPRDGERARELCLGGLHLLRLDEQLAVVVEHVGGVGEGRLSVGEDTARLGRLLRAVQRHAELDARQDRAGVELHRLAQVVHCRRDLGLQDVELAAVAVDVSVRAVEGERCLEVGDGLRLLLALIPERGALEQDVDRARPQVDRVVVQGHRLGVVAPQMQKHARHRQRRRRRNRGSARRVCGVRPSGERLGALLHTRHRDPHPVEPGRLGREGAVGPDPAPLWWREQRARGEPVLEGGLVVADSHVAHCPAAEQAREGGALGRRRAGDRRAELRRRSGLGGEDRAVALERVDEGADEGGGRQRAHWLRQPGGGPAASEKTQDALSALVGDLVGHPGEQRRGGEVGEGGLEVAAPLARDAAPVKHLDVLRVDGERRVAVRLRLGMLLEHRACLRPVAEEDGHVLVPLVGRELDGARVLLARLVVLPPLESLVAEVLGPLCLRMQVLGSSISSAGCLSWRRRRRRRSGCRGGPLPAGAAGRAWQRTCRARAAH